MEMSVLHVQNLIIVDRSQQIRMCMLTNCLSKFRSSEEKESPSKLGMREYIS